MKTSSSLPSLSFNTLFPFLFSFTLVSLSIVLPLLLSSTPAYASTLPPETLYPTARVTGIAGSNALGPNAFYLDISVEDDYPIASYGHNEPYYNDHIALCIHPGHPYPENGLSSGGYFNWVKNDQQAGIAWYKGVLKFSEIPNSYGTPYQDLGEIYLGIHWNFKGWIAINKTSALPALTDGIADYSLAGATYDLYRTSDNSWVTTLTTDQKGEARSDGLDPGNYFLKEKEAPKGFKVDTTHHQITVESGETSSLALTDEPLVWLELLKASSNPLITKGNACYSLENAVYGVYRTTDDASQDKNRMSTLTTNPEGYAKSPTMLPLGEYCIKEIQAPKGYAKDTTLYATTLDKTLTRVTTCDTPQGKPLRLIVTKIDADTHVNLPQGNASLEGAEFSIAYYDGYYDTVFEAELSGAPTRTWIIRTDEKGEGFLHESSLTGESDALYHNSQGSATLPLGTVIIRETKAPDHYLLPDPAPVSIHQIIREGEYENVSTFNYPSLPDKVVRGDISLTKSYNPTPKEDTGIMTPEKDILFDFYASHQFEGTLPKEGVTPAFTLTTDEKGHADTAALYLIKNADGTYSQRARNNNDDGALPYDTYLMVQRNTLPGFEKLNPQIISIVENRKNYDYLLQNGTIQTPLRVVKIDSETARPVPYPACWQIIDSLTNKPISMTTHYPTVQTLKTFTSDKEGRLILPEKLPHGNYELTEVSAPANKGIGYVLSPASIGFSTEDGHDWNNPLEVVFPDVPSKGKIILTKRDSLTQKALAGATYFVRAVGNIYTLDGTLRTADGETVDTLTTDASGNALSRDLYLGHYEVVENIRPEGFALDTTPHEVILEYEDQTVEVVSHTLELSDEPTRIRIIKQDALTEKVLAGVSFSLRSHDGSFEKPLVTNEEGIAELSYLPQGTYTVQEAETPYGYVSASETFDFTVDEKGLIEGSPLYTLSLTNSPLQVHISKVDSVTLQNLPHCGLELYQSDTAGNPLGDPLFSWESTDEPYTLIARLAPGDYLLHETYAASGYAKAEDMPFKVENSAALQTVVMKDNPLPPPPDKGYDKTGFDSLPFIATIFLLSIGGFLGLLMGIHRYRQKVRISEYQHYGSV